MVGFVGNRHLREMEGVEEETKVSDRCGHREKRLRGTVRLKNGCTVC